ncbi:16S rRNA (guanine(527)-N(7))-methyltransferase RsmG [Albibacillus kandeliae]|uniref:16S rRNA (guanine(527)-N(7))-methyltransferase RsmG n=1 Tax=Albibacillus kandeliae TaxID=2174228 RepID=UPI000D68CD61|nr:16S rRNA (guanine(527)-N(7))-methyltransferase RsmG [Albibacillus kandeliae]
MSGDRIGQLDVSRETMERLETYVELLKKWNPRINLVSRRSLEDLWSRHFVDSAQLHSLAGQGAGSWVDMGSGGGFPGLVVAILGAEFTPERRFTLIESDQRKSAFLRTAIRETGVACNVISQRIEAVPPQGAAIISARALADLTALLAFSERHLAPDGLAVFPKGANWKKEVDEARTEWRFDLDAITSWTEPDAAVLLIKGVTRE